MAGMERNLQSEGVEKNLDLRNTQVGTSSLLSRPLLVVFRSLPLELFMSRSAATTARRASLLFALCALTVGCSSGSKSSPPPQSTAGQPPEPGSVGDAHDGSGSVGPGADEDEDLGTTDHGDTGEPEEDGTDTPDEPQEDPEEDPDAAANDADGDGVCDEDEIEGCTGDSAFNFQPDATDDDGSCLYPVPPPPSFEVTGTPASGTMFGQATLDGAAADGYDWIGAFDEDGNCAGASQLIINEGIAYINLTIYGDDATTPEADEGMTGDEPFFLVLWDESAQTTIYFNANGSPSTIEGWTNTNGAPIPGLDDSDNVYEFSTDDYEPNCNDSQACNFDAASTVNVGCVIQIISIRTYRLKSMIIGHYKNNIGGLWFFLLTRSKKCD